MRPHLFPFFLWALCQPFLARADDTEEIAAFFRTEEAKGSVITIPPGDYHLSGSKPILLGSRTTILAYGARFHLPENLPGETRLVLFAGSNLSDFAWHGGEFLGHVFDPSRKENTWEPATNTRAIEITTTRPGGTHDIVFRDVKADGIAGAVIGVHGLAKSGTESEVEVYAERVVLENCTLLRCGKFMWDYGYLWQILTWPEEYEDWEVERASRYFRMDLVKSPLVIAAGDDHIQLDNRSKPILVSPDSDPKHALSFLGEGLPKNLGRGKQYFVVEAGPDFIRIAETPGGGPIRFESRGGEGLSLVHNLFAAFWSLYAPVGSGPGKGAFDITGAKDVRVTNCMLSALGDTMHIQRCRNIVFANNHIVGSRMGAFFLAEFCQNASITGNLIDGTNGSRVMSVEKSCEDVTITGNTFRNGGRGSWINQPKNLLLANNVFVNNTTKGENDLRRGRRSYETGEPRRFPELYFTLHEEDGGYGPVIVRDNIFQLGDSAPEEAVTFAPNGRDLQMSGNSFPGRSVIITVDPSCEGVAIHDNPGAEVKRSAVDFNHGRR